MSKTKHSAKSRHAQRLSALAWSKDVLELSQELLRIAPECEPNGTVQEMGAAPQLAQLYHRCEHRTPVCAHQPGIKQFHQSLDRLKPFLQILPFRGALDEFRRMNSEVLWLAFCVDQLVAGFPENERTQDNIQGTYAIFVCRMWLTRSWLHQGRVFRITSQLSRTFQIADIPVSANCLRLPFSSMLIETSSWFSTTVKGEEHALAGVLVSLDSAVDGAPVICLLGLATRSTSYNVLQTIELGKTPTLQKDLEYYAAEQKASGQVLTEEPLCRLVNFVCNVILYCSSFSNDVLPNNEQKVKKLEEQLKRQQGVKRQKTGQKLQQARGDTIYILGTNFRLDDERVTKELSQEDGRRVQVRHIVRGHWRNQACGPQQRDRKLIFVQPFWRGSGTASPRKTYVVKQHAASSNT